jgi:phospholipid/cholesterol/gamma-HCH transport system ATP-binding protein
MENILEIKHLKKSFGDKVVHRDVSFGIQKGEIVGLLGNSGTGKSVMLRCLVGLETMDDGEVWFQKKRIDLLSEEAMFKIRTKISYAFQSGALFDSMSVYDNIAYPLREHQKLTIEEEEKRVQDILTLVHLKDSGTLFPSDLSGGMQKRAGLARAMVLSPDVILYDEPTAGLDPVNVENVLEIMRSFRERGAAGIFVTHDIPAAQKVCDRMMVIDSGKIAFQGTVQEFDHSNDPVVQKFHVGL